jgi:hypothetical protein
MQCNPARGTHHELTSRREPLTPRKAWRGRSPTPDCVSLHPENGFEIAGLFRLLEVLPPIDAPWMGAVRSHSRLGRSHRGTIAFFSAPIRRRVTVLARIANSPVTGWRPPQGAAAMTDQSDEIPQDLRNLVRVVSACTLGLWAFAAGLLIGVFLFS